MSTHNTCSCGAIRTISIYSDEDLSIATFMGTNIFHTGACIITNDQARVYRIVMNVLGQWLFKIGR